MNSEKKAMTVELDEEILDLINWIKAMEICKADMPKVKSKELADEVFKIIGMKLVIKCKDIPF